MTTTTTALAESQGEDLLANFEEDHEIQRVDVGAVAALERSEIMAQIDAAYAHPRRIKKFVQDALSMATLNVEVAQSCMYALPRGGKLITGPSVRLSEICQSAWGNMHVGSRVVDVLDKEIVAEGIAWDLERNLRVRIESRRRITKKDGSRYDDDMITVTGNAAAAIGRRNAVFTVIPRAYVDAIYAKVREVAVGEAKTLEVRRDAVLANFEKLGVARDRVFAKVGKTAVEEIGLDELELLIGIGTAIRSGTARIEEYFPAPTASATSPAAAALEEKLRGSAAGPAKKKEREPGEEG